MSIKQFGVRLKEIRKANQLTQLQLAEKCGLNHTYICLLERGHRDPSLSNFMQICKGLKCNPNDLLRI